MFAYAVMYYDEVDGKDRLVSGIVKADGFNEAMERLVEYFSEDLLISIEKLYELDDVLCAQDLMDIYDLGLKN